MAGVHDSFIWEKWSLFRGHLLVFRGVGCSLPTFGWLKKVSTTRSTTFCLWWRNQKENSQVWIKHAVSFESNHLKAWLVPLWRLIITTRSWKSLRTGRGFCKKNQAFSCWDWWSFVVTVLSFGRWYCSNTLRGVSRYRFYTESFSSWNIRCQIFTGHTTISMWYLTNINIGLVKSCELIIFCQQTKSCSVVMAIFPANFQFLLLLLVSNQSFLRSTQCKDSARQVAQPINGLAVRCNVTQEKGMKGIMDI